MKIKIYTLAIILGFIGNHALYAQMTGGGGGNSAQKAAKSQNPNSWSFMHFGLSQPVGKFKEGNLNKWIEDAVGAKPGIYIGFDFANYFSSTIDNPVKLGIMESIQLAVNGVNWDGYIPGADFYGTPFVLLEVKVGLIGTYEINNDTQVDGFFKLGLNSGIGGGGEWDSGFGSFSVSADNFALNVGTGLGGNLRYKNLMFTMQYSIGKLKFNYYGDAFDETIKVPISTFRMGIGFKMGKKN